ncbi:tetratricopeptide repeat protein [Verrucomicrobiota bacterium sgz303538]
MIARLAFFLFAIAGAVSGKDRPTEKAPTFNGEIAPIIFSHCVECHHPGGAGAFSLATYTDVKKRAKLIARVTANRYMPPWLPEPGHGDFLGERRLSDEQIALIGRWWNAGAPQGAAADLQVKPQWSDDWRFGKPDLVVTLPESYTLPAGGKDVYRNFVIPNVVLTDRYLRASEFRPGAAAIHHAFVLLDDTGGARRRAARETAPGFPGMDTAGAGAPDAMFMGWQPGKRPAEAPPGLAAVLRKGSDLVLQLHMRPTGKPEKIQPSVALYFADQPPTRSAFMLLLRSVDVDIPPGASDYAIESSYKLPVDVDALSILPHLHYLGKEVHGWAELPDGTQRELILIKQWDFNWQGDYRYATPVFLPKGSTLRMRFTYDNSASNARNPNQPPKRVTYGLQSSDEMGELWLQLLPRNPGDLDVLRRDFAKNKGLPDSIAWATAMLLLNPKDAATRAKLGTALAVAGRTDEAIQALEQAIADDPKLARANYVLGQVFLRQQNATKAKTAFERAVALDPDNANMQNDLGWLLLATGEISKAIEHLEKAVQLNPADALARQNLEKARAMNLNR